MCTQSPEDGRFQKFRVDGRYFVYDRSSRAILGISRNVYTILDDYFRFPAAHLRQSYSKQMSEDDIGTAIGCLDRAVRMDGRFSTPRPGDYARILDREFFEQGLKTGLRNLCLTVTEQCNQRCNYCINSGKYSGEFQHNQRTMTWDVAKRSIDYYLPRTDPAANAGLSFFGGEPMLAWSLVQRCVRYIKANYALMDNLAMTLVTNATLLTQRAIDFIIDNDLSLQISLDGPKPVHDSSRVFPDGHGSYERVMEVLREIRRKDPEYFSSRVSIACCIDRNKDLIRLFRFFNGAEFEGLKVSLNPIKEDDAGYYVEDSRTRKHYSSELDRLVDIFLSVLRAEGRFNHPLFRELLFRVFKLGWDPITPDMAKDRFPNPICLPGISKIYVATDGTFYPCERVRVQGTEIGDCRNGVNIDKAHALIKMFADFCAQNCDSCWAHGLCCHCFVHFLSKGKLVQQKKFEYCQREKDAIVEGFKRFIYIWENECGEASANPESLHSYTEKVRYFTLH